MPFNGSSIYYVRKIFHKFNISAYICISGGSRAPDEILEMPGPKKFWMPLWMMQKRISLENIPGKVRFQKKWGGEEGHG